MEIIIDSLISNKELSFLIFFCAEMWQKQLKKCNKYKLVIFLDERRFSFASFLHLFIQVPSLTHSALLWDYLGTSWGLPWDYLATIRRPPVQYFFCFLRRWPLLGDHYETTRWLLSDYWANNIRICNCTYIFTENVIWSGFISHLMAFVKMFQKTLMKNVEPTKDTKNAPPLKTW